MAEAGSNIVIGAFSDNTGASDAGSAYVYNTSTWTYETINNPTPEATDYFGIAVAGTENYIVIGAPLDNTGATSAGSVYVYNTSTWAYETINNPTPADYEYFGNSVATIGDDILVGVPYDSTSASAAGIAYLFDTSGNLLQTFYNPDPNVNDFFGSAVASVGNYILIGAEGDNSNAGAVHIFALNGNFLQTIDNPTPVSGDDFGAYSIAAVGNNLIIGANGDDTNQSNAGSAYYYEYSGPPIPEPATLLLLGSALFGLVPFRKKFFK